MKTITALRPLPTKYRLLYDELLSIGDLEYVRCGVLPILAVCLALEKLNVLKVLRILASKLPVYYSLNFFHL